MELLGIPSKIDSINPQKWETYEPYFSELMKRPITSHTARQWLQDWSDLTKLFWEAYMIIYIEKTIDTTDEEKERAFLDIINDVMPQAQIAEQVLKEKLLTLNLTGMDDMSIVLRDMRNEAELFREKNVPLSVELAKLSNEYDKITARLEIDWDGEKKNLSQLTTFLHSKDRAVRQRAWLSMMGLWLEKRQELNQLYTNMLELRQQVAQNANLSDYRAYIFRERGRFDYTPEDCLIFHEAIEAIVVPAAERIYEKKRLQLGVKKLRPWDVQVDTSEAPALAPYQTQADLIAGSLNVFQKIDPELAKYFATMAEEKLLDLDTRSGKALGGYCSSLPVRKRPFIFMNGVGIHDDVQTLLHEAGHAFHAFESFSQPLIWQMNAPMEFSEVASMSMELLAAPYMTKENGAFYTPAEVARARIEHLEGVITFLPFMAVVDAFQHWVYTHPDEAKDANACDQTWDKLWSRFMKGVEWSGYEDARVSGWHRKLHIFTVPFYYIEYGMAQIGALQVWQNSLKDQSTALNLYRKALAMGGTKTLPQLFVAAGAEFRFDTSMLTALIGLIETTIANLEQPL